MLKSRPAPASLPPLARAGRNVLVKLAGELAARVLFALLFIYAARLLGAADFGRYSFAASLAALAFIGMDLGLNTLLVREGAQHPEQVGRYAGTLFVLKSLLAAAVLLGLLAFCLGMNYPRQQTLLVMAVALGQTFWGYCELGVAGFNALERMEQEALVKSLARLLALLLAGGMLLAGLGLWGLVVGLLAANLAAAVLALTRLGGLVGWRVRPQMAAAGRFMREGLPLALTSVFMLVYFRVDMVMLELLGEGFVEIGWYGAAVRVIDAAGMLPALVMASLLPVLSSLAPRDRQAMTRLYRQGQRLLLMLGLPAALGMWMLRRPFTELVFGPQYEGTVAAFAWLSPMLAVLFLNHLQLGQLTALGLQRLCAWATGTCVLVNLGLNLALIPLYGYQGAAAATLATEAVLFGLCGWFIHRHLGPTGLLKRLWRPAAATALMGLALNWRGDWPLLAVVPAAMVLYGAALLLMGGITPAELRELADTLRVRSAGDGRRQAG